MNLFDKYYPILGEDKFKVENLPSSLYNSIEREHFLIDFEEAVCLLMYITGLEKMLVSGLFDMDEIKDLIVYFDKIMADIDKKFTKILREHHFDSRGCFVKFSNVSPKDKSRSPIHSFEEFLNAIKDSKRIKKELYNAVLGKISGSKFQKLEKHGVLYGKPKGNHPLTMPLIKPEDYSQLAIILNEWINDEQLIEFRTFVFDKRVYFLSQYKWWKLYDEIAKNPDQITDTLRETISRMQNNLIAPDLVADFWLTKDLKTSKFIEFNPYEKSDTVYFNQEIDQANLPISVYKSLDGLFRFTGVAGNGYENTSLEYILPPPFWGLSSEEKQTLLEAHKDIAGDYEDMSIYCKAYETLSQKDFVISQKKLKR